VDKAALETRVKHIADRDLFAALRLDGPELAEVRAASRGEDPLAPWQAWREYLLAHRGRRTLAEPGEPVGAAQPRGVLQEADLVVRRDIKCWGGVRVRYPGEVDFSRNLAGSSNYGFHYFGWIVPLALAWRETGRERYARAFVEIFRQWYRQRDLVKGDIPSFDVIWYELGIGARLPVFAELYFATLGSGAARDPGYHRDMLKTVLGHGRLLYDYETVFRPGNFQVTASRSLLLAGLAFPELRESSRWVRRGMRYLVAHADRDVYADGCHKERSPHYHLGVAANMSSTAELARGRPDLAPGRRKLEETGRRMLRWTATIMTPSRHSPVVGDSEYDIPERAIEREGVALPGGASVDLPDSGFVVIRSGWKPGDLWFLLNYGPYGGGHSHAEALAFQLWSGGTPVAVDCGRGVNYDDPLHESWYVTPHAHNMVVVDGAAPSIPGRRGRFLFHARPTGAHFVGLEHTGYRELGVGHRRCFLLSTERRYLVVLDSLRARDQGHRYEWVLNTPVAGVRVGVGRATARGLTVLCAEPDAVDEVSTERVRMCLPLEGRSTWGLPRGQGTNLRFRWRGGSGARQFLVMPAASPAGVRFAVERTGRSPGRMRVVVAAPGFEDRWLVDCGRGSVRRG
jgi:hypothetical protein